jgi:hypothetical protein
MYVLYDDKIEFTSDNESGVIEYVEDKLNDGADSSKVVILSGEEIMFKTKIKLLHNTIAKV